jgi:Fe-S-cluster containining protein
MTGTIAATAFFERLRQQLRPALERAGSAADCAELMTGLYACLESELQPLDRGSIACAPGCGSCCVVNVAVLLPEAVALVEHLRHRPLAGEALTRGVRELYGRIGGLDEQARLALQIPCAFLSDQGECLVYPVRPLLCRSVTSTDPAACRAALTAADPAEAPPVLMSLQQKALCESAFMALAETVRALGLDDHSTTLTTAVYHLLEQPELAQSWLAGAAVPRS